MNRSRWIIIVSVLNTYRPIKIKPISGSGTPLLAMGGPKIAPLTILYTKMSGSRWIITIKTISASGTPLLDMGAHKLLKMAQNQVFYT